MKSEKKYGNLQSQTKTSSFGFLNNFKDYENTLLNSFKDRKNSLDDDKFMYKSQHKLIEQNESSAITLQNSHTNIKQTNISEFKSQYLKSQISLNNRSNAFLQKNQNQFYIPDNYQSIKTSNDQTVRTKIPKDYFIQADIGNQSHSNSQNPIDQINNILDYKSIPKKKINLQNNIKKRKINSQLSEINSYINNNTISQNIFFKDFQNERSLLQDSQSAQSKQVNKQQNRYNQKETQNSFSQNPTMPTIPKIKNSQFQNSIIETNTSFNSVIRPQYPGIAVHFSNLEKHKDLKIDKHNLSPKNNIAIKNDALQKQNVGILKKLDKKVIDERWKRIINSSQNRLKVQNKKTDIQNNNFSMNNIILTFEDLSNKLNNKNIENQLKQLDIKKQKPNQKRDISKNSINEQNYQSLSFRRNFNSLESNKNNYINSNKHEQNGNSKNQLIQTELLITDQNKNDNYNMKKIPFIERNKRFIKNQQFSFDEEPKLVTKQNECLNQARFRIVKNIQLGDLQLKKNNSISQNFQKETNISQDDQSEEQMMKKKRSLKHYQIWREKLWKNPYVSDTFVTNIQQFKNSQELQIEKQNQEKLHFKNSEFDEICQSFKYNQKIGKSGVDPNITQSNQGLQNPKIKSVLNGNFSQQFLQQKEAKKEEKVDFDKVIDFQKEINNIMVDQLINERQKNLKDIKTKNIKTKIQKNHKEQRRLQMRENAKGQNHCQSQATLREYNQNRQHDKNGNYQKYRGLAQLGSADENLYQYMKSSIQIQPHSTIDASKIEKHSSHFLLPKKKARSTSTFHIVTKHTKSNNDLLLNTKNDIDNLKKSTIDEKSDEYDKVQKNGKIKGRYTFQKYWKDKETVVKHIRDSRTEKKNQACSIDKKNERFITQNQEFFEIKGQKINIIEQLKIRNSQNISFRNTEYNNSNVFPKKIIENTLKSIGSQNLISQRNVSNKLQDINEKKNSGQESQQKLKTNKSISDLLYPVDQRRNTSFTNEFHKPELQMKIMGLYNI